jgi:hypothetical protein
VAGTERVAALRADQHGGLAAGAVVDKMGVGMGAVLGWLAEGEASPQAAEEAFAGAVCAVFVC